MSDNIYLIDTIDGIYVGKLATTDVWNAHLKRTDLPWYRGNPQDESISSRWEVRWTTDIYANGYANQKYVRSIHIWPTDTVAAAIKKSFETIGIFSDKGIKYTGYEALRQAWHLPGQTDTEITEALMILLAAKNHDMLNTQVDFLTKLKSRITADDAVNMLSEQSFEARELRALVRTPDIFITITPQNNFMGIIEGITNRMKNELEAQGRSRVRISLDSSFLPQLSQAVTKSTLEHLIRTLNNYKRTIVGTRTQVAEARRMIQNHIKILQNYIKDPSKMKNASGEIYNVSELYTQTLEAMNGARTKYKTVLQASRHDDFKILAAGLRDWYETYNLEDFLFNGQEVEKSVRPYCFAMTKWLSDKVFGDVYDAAYSEAQHTRWAERMEASGGRGIVKLPPTAEPYAAPGEKDVALQYQTLDRLQKLAPRATYLQAHWKIRQVYAEQVTYWLATKGDTFYQNALFSRYYPATAYMSALTDNISDASKMPPLKYY